MRLTRNRITFSGKFSQIALKVMRLQTSKKNMYGIDKS